MTTKIPERMLATDMATQAELDAVSATVALKAVDTAVVHNTGNETIAGTKTFSSQPVLPQKLTQGTAVATTSGTSIDFTSIPSWVKRITVMFNGVSTNGTSIPIVQIGPTAAVETTGYLGATELNGTGGNNSAGFTLGSSWAAAVVFYGTLVLQQIDSTSNTWVATINLGRSDSTGYMTGGGAKALAGVLARVRVTMTNGTDTFDAGSINIIYE